jgi:putative restriction endonuclease
VRGFPNDPTDRRQQPSVVVIAILVVVRVGAEFAELMRALVLESFVGSDYADSPNSYEFPPQYLRFFEPLTRGEPLIAVIYEPRGESNLGRMSYVGWTVIKDRAVLSGRRNARGQPLYQVTYADRYREFDRMVPREAIGEPVETWLRSVQRGRARNVATFGRAVRTLIPEDLQLILSLGVPTGVGRLGQEVPRDHQFAEAMSTEERTRRLVSVVQREARFRDDVLAAYGHRCSISGLAVGTSPSRAYGLVDAAHIRPVGSHGADLVSNGLALTPTLHRMFDKGLFTLAYKGAALEVRTSPQLRDAMTRGNEGFHLRLVDGLQASLPPMAGSWPSREAVDYHQSLIFQAR